MESTPRSMGHRYRDWSNLPTDLLELIPTKLSFSDFLSFKGATHTKGNIIVSQRDVYCDDHKVVGSHPDGWLILEDKVGHCFLLELLTHVRIDLPKLIKYNTSQDTYIEKAILSDNPNCRQDFTVIMLHHNGKNHKLAFWRNGDRRWSLLVYDNEQRCSDIVWCNDSLYKVTIFGNLLVEVWDLNRNGTSFSFCKKKPRIDKFNPQLTLTWMFATKQLVASSTGEVLLVSYWLNECRVFKLDLEEEQWPELRTLNGQALVKGKGNFFCLSSIDVEKNGYKANSIYVTKHESWSNGKFGRRIKLSNYSLEDKKVEELWETSIPLDIEVTLQPLGLFSLNIKSCDLALQQMV